MSVWERIGQSFSSATQEALTAFVEQIRAALAGDANTRRQVAFSVAMIALSAKMAKADGVVTEDEVAAFRQIFAFGDEQAEQVSRLYNLARQDVAGYESYASQVTQLFPDDDMMRKDVLDGLFHIAKADGVIHDRELQYLDTVADIFGIVGTRYRRIKARHVGPRSGDPWLLLAADPSWDDERLKRRYRELVRENHPDLLAARGVPPEFTAIANDRLAAINAAWELIRGERGF
jgi:DnaJ like chaperone protein